MVGHKHAAHLVRMAKKQDRIEQQWVYQIGRLNEALTEQLAESFKQTGKPKLDPKLIYEFLLAHYFKVVGSAAEDATEEMDVIIESPTAKLAKVKIPKSMRDLRIIYDKYRKTNKLPPGLKEMGDKIKEEYLKKTQSVWRKYSEDFRNGDEATQEDVLRKIKKAADTASSRAKTIVRTETTNYYNQTRQEIYEQTTAVTHYLFLAIRDQATTQWCSDKSFKGKRGRHGLVYKADDELRKEETPACHWNCRSEMVPLTPYNPRHIKLIEDETIQRRNNKCTPLPEGWR